MRLPGCEVGEVRLRLLCQLGYGRTRQRPVAHVSQRLGVDHVIGVAGAEQVEEVQPALAARGGEPGEMLVADLGAHAVGRPVPRASVVHAQPGRMGQAGAQHVTGFVDEAILPGDQQAHDLALGQVEADRPQLRQQPCHPVTCPWWC